MSRAPPAPVDEPKREKPKLKKAMVVVVSESAEGSVFSQIQPMRE